MMRLQKFLFTCLLFSFGAFSLHAQKVGVMIMAHGGSAEWNDLVKEAAKPLEKQYAVAFAWGMADPATLQQAVTQLENDGVTKIVAVPLFISSYSPIIRQTEYLLGKRDSLADDPMPPMDHSGGHMSMPGMSAGAEDHSMHHMHSMSKADLHQLKVKADVVLTHALDDHDVVASILLDRIHELSKTPEKETVVLVGHGPNDEGDNQKWIETMESLVQKIQNLQQKEGGKAYKQIFSTTVRDDASKAIFNQAKAQLRAIVRQSGNNGDVLVVPLFLSSGGREQAVAERLEGLKFKWTGHTLLPDAALSRFLQASVQDAL